MIDLNRNFLRIGTTGTETPFLTEAELPEGDRLSGANDEEMMDKPEDDPDLQQALAESSKTADHNVSDGMEKKLSLRHAIFCCMRHFVVCNFSSVLKIPFLF